jgi:hypothetical protein
VWRVSKHANQAWDTQAQTGQEEGAETAGPTAMARARGNECQSVRRLVYFLIQNAVYLPG